MTTTRRTVIAGAAALPLLPAVALAVPVTLPAYATPADPAVEAYRIWQEAFDTFCPILETSTDDDCPVLIAAEDAEIAAGQAVTDAVATTPEGIAAQIRFAFYTFGTIPRGGDWHNPADYDPESFNREDGKALLLSMLTGAERMAGASS